MLNPDQYGNRWFRLVLVVVVAMGTLSVPQAKAQTAGACCQSIISTSPGCQSNGCSGSVTINECQSTGYGPGNIYTETKVGCCNIYFYTLQGPSGSCIMSQPVVSQPETALSLLPRRKVWVRTCNGDYALAKLT